jgi:hypothetical protein
MRPERTTYYIQIPACTYLDGLLSGADGRARVHMRFPIVLITGASGVSETRAKRTIN